MSKQDRQGARTPADLERKYNFDRSFAEIMGIATDARLYAENAQNIATSIAELSDGIVLKVKGLDDDMTEVQARLDLKVETDAEGNLVSKIHVSSDKFTVDTYNFTLDKDGNVKVTGEINAKSGVIGGCTIKDGVLQITSKNISEKLTADAFDTSSIEESVLLEMESYVSVELGKVESRVAETYATKEGLGLVDSKITQTADQIKLEVEETYASKESVSSQITQTASDILFDVSKTYTSRDQFDDQMRITNAQLALRVETDEEGNLVSKVHIKGNLLTIDTDNFTLDESGNVKMTGEVTATSGDIGNWHINNGFLETEGFAISTPDVLKSDTTIGAHVGTDGIYVVGSGTTATMRAGTVCTENSTLCSIVAATGIRLAYCSNIANPFFKVSRSGGLVMTDSGTSGAGNEIFSVSRNGVVNAMSYKVGGKDGMNLDVHMSTYTLHFNNGILTGYTDANGTLNGYA